MPRAKKQLRPWPQRLGLAVATGGYSGYAPVAPGTFGTLVALPLAWAAGQFGVAAQALLAVAAVGVGVWASQQALSVFKKHDAPQIVVDEMAGFWITMVGVPVTPYWLIWGFCLFRIFDIFKPFPIGLLDRKVKGSWGVMLDDLAAGLFANILLQLMLRAAL